MTTKEKVGIPIIVIATLVICAAMVWDKFRPKQQETHEAVVVEKSTNRSSTLTVEVEGKRHELYVANLDRFATLQVGDTVRVSYIPRTKIVKFAQEE